MSTKALAILSIIVATFFTSIGLASMHVPIDNNLTLIHTEVRVLDEKVENIERAIANIERAITNIEGAITKIKLPSKPCQDDSWYGVDNERLVNPPHSWGGVPWWWLLRENMRQPYPNPFPNPPPNPFPGTNPFHNPYLFQKPNPYPDLFPNFNKIVP